MSPHSAALGIFVNDQPRELAGGSTVLDLLQELGLSDKKGIAAAINGEVVPRSSWADRTLLGGDRVLVIRATQGG